jgi:hypothetical protein
MTISSRTPEGEPNHCPICGLHFQLEPSPPAGDGPCPGCGHLLWFSSRRNKPTLESGSDLVGAGELEEFRACLLRIAAARVGPPPSRSIRAAINAVRRLDVLKKLLERALTASRWDELVPRR